MDSLKFDSIPNEWAFLIKDIASPLAIVVACVFAYLLARRGLKLLESEKTLAAPVVSLLRMLLRWVFALLVIFLLLSAFGILEYVWAAFLGIIAMLAVGFVAVWSVLSNIFCTLLLLIYKPFQVGDWVKIPAENLEGEVVDLNLMFTTLRGADDDTIRIPNNQFFQKAIRCVPGETQTDLYEQLKTNENDTVN